MSLTFGDDVTISIHAPLRERRARLCIIGARQMNFNPRSLTGATADDAEGMFEELFQSTLPYGSDVKSYEEKITPMDFNPRSLTGATFLSMTENIGRLFQSTLPYGSDFTAYTITAVIIISIHAPLRERLKKTCC